MARRQAGLLKTLTESGVGLVKAVSSALAEATDSLIPTKGTKAATPRRRTSSEHPPPRAASKRKEAAAKGTTGKRRKKA